MSINTTIAVPYDVMRDYLRGNPTNRIASMAQNFDKVWIISITNPQMAARNDNVSPLISDGKDRIALQFHDVDSPDCDWKTIPFDSEMAEKIVAFIKKAHSNGTNDMLVVNCHAGISRSGAVSYFARHVFGIDYSTWKRQNPQVIPNSLVLELLAQAWEKTSIPV